MIPGNALCCILFSAATVAEPATIPSSDTTYAAAALEGYRDPDCATPRWKPLGTFAERPQAEKAIGERIGLVIVEVRQAEPGAPYSAVLASRTHYVNVPPPAAAPVDPAGDVAACAGIEIATWGRSYAVDGAHRSVRLVDAAGSVVERLQPRGELPGPGALPSGVYFLVVEDEGGRMCPEAVPLVR